MNTGTKGAIQAVFAFISFMMGMGIILQGAITGRQLVIALFLIALAVYLAYSAHKNINIGTTMPK